MLVWSLRLADDSGTKLNVAIGENYQSQIGKYLNFLVIIQHALQSNGLLNATKEIINI